MSSSLYTDTVMSAADVPSTFDTTKLLILNTLPEAAAFDTTAVAEVVVKLT
jgi:hypothetical protein